MREISDPDSYYRLGVKGKIFSLSSHTAPVMSLRWSRCCGKSVSQEKLCDSAIDFVLVSGGKDGKIRLWRMEAVLPGQKPDSVSSSASGHFLTCTGIVDALIESKVAVNSGQCTIYRISCS